MRYHFGVQVILLISALLTLFLSLFNHELLIWMLIIQFLVGIYQYFGSSIMVARPGKMRRIFLIHWQLSSADLALLVVLIFLIERIPSNIIFYLKVSIFYVVPWSLAIYYFILSFKILGREK